MTREEKAKALARERQIAIRSDELYRDRMSSHWNELRERAAIAAMQGYCSLQEVFVNYPEEQVAGLAVKQADALIEELKKKSNE